MVTFSRYQNGAMPINNIYLAEITRLIKESLNMAIDSLRMNLR